MKRSFIWVLFLWIELGNCYSKYGRDCRDITCLRTEECVLAEDPCPLYSSNRENCGTYPKCERKRSGGSTPQTCSSKQCGYDEYCQEVNGIAKCLKKGEIPEEQQMANNKLTRRKRQIQNLGDNLNNFDDAINNSGNLPPPHPLPASNNQNNINPIQFPIGISNFIPPNSSSQFPPEGNFGNQPSNTNGHPNGNQPTHYPPTNLGPQNNQSPYGNKDPGSSAYGSNWNYPPENSGNNHNYGNPYTNGHSTYGQNSNYPPENGYYDGGWNSRHHGNYQGPYGWNDNNNNNHGGGYNNGGGYGGNPHMGMSPYGYGSNNYQGQSNFNQNIPSQKTDENNMLTKKKLAKLAKEAVAEFFGQAVRTTSTKFLNSMYENNPIRNHNYY